MKQEHLDAEVVASWADGSLDPQARAAAESHAADCARCQAVLAAMVRTEPAAVQPGRGWLGARVRWLVPLATAAAALALWVALSTDALAPGTPPQVARRAEPTAAAEGDRDAATPAPAIAPGEAPKQQIAPDETRRRPVDAAAPPPVRAEASRPGEKSTDVAANVTVDQLRRDVLRGRPTAAPTVAPPAVAGPVPPPPPAPEKPAAAQPKPTAVLTETVPAERQTPPAQTQAARPRAELAATPSQMARRAAFSTDAAVVREIASSDPSVRYRFGPKGLIQRSADSGRTWSVQQSGVTLDLFSASAPSADVCWVVGRSGVVLLTTDGGATWQRLPFPEPADLRTVEATDARTATVTTLDALTFRTVDGGQNWRR